MQIYNARNIDRNGRFLISMLVGFVSAIALGIIYGRIRMALPLEMEVFYIVIGMIIANIVRYFGHGVTQKFAVLGAVLAFLAIFVGDIVSYFGVNFLLAGLFKPSIWVYLFNRIFFSRITSIWGILAIAFRAVGIYVAYQYSRIL